MNNFKKLPMALTVVGLGAAASFGEIKLTDNLSTTGFLDMSTVTMANSDTTISKASFDQLELDFMWKMGNISARADINSLGGGPVAFEQGYVTGTMGSVALSVGRFLSSSGFEAAEPTGMYQYSYNKGLFYGGYQNGINIAWTSPMIGLYGAIVTDIWNAAETDIGKTPGFEGQISLTPAEGVTAKATYLYQVLDSDLPGGDGSQQELNVWGSYAKGPLTAALEYSLLIDWVVPDGAGTVNDGMGHGWMAMANYKFTDRFAGTLRYSGNKLGDADPDQEVTISPSFSVSPNWLTLAEVRFDIDQDPMLTTVALESTFSF